MSTISGNKLASTVKVVLTGGAVVLGLALSTGQLTAASLATGASGLDRVSQPGISATALRADSSPDVFARAKAARDALGFPVGAKRSGRHVQDGGRKVSYDEVSEVDTADRPIALTQFDGSGRLLAAVRFDSPTASAASTTPDAATRAAQRGLAASGVPVSGQPQADADSTSGGWNVHWARTQGGLPVRGDETRVHVWQDGRIQSVASVQHDLASAPARRLDQAAATNSVSSQLGRWFAGSESAAAIQGMDLEWVGPNAAFDPSKLDATPAPYRLAWVANVKPSGPVAQSVRLITLYIDAGDGTVLGGDVVE
jgi:hypothetical protein